MVDYIQLIIDALYRLIVQLRYITFIGEFIGTNLHTFDYIFTMC